MIRRRLLLGVLIVASLAGAAYVSQETETAASKMTTAAEKFVDSLTMEQKAKAERCSPSTHKDRTNSNFVPLQEKGVKPLHKGLTLEEMNAGSSRTKAEDLLRAGTSEAGFNKATTIMSLESILKELEKGGANVRNPGWYFFSIFGQPGKKGDWGYRIEGHHLSLNFTFKDGKLIGSTPAIFGANPAKVMNGDVKKGMRTLPEAEDNALDLYNALDDDQLQGRGAAQAVPGDRAGHARSRTWAIRSACPPGR